MCSHAKPTMKSSLRTRVQIGAVLLTWRSQEKSIPNLTWFLWGAQRHGQSRGPWCSASESLALWWCNLPSMLPLTVFILRKKCDQPTVSRFLPLGRFRVSHEILTRWQSTRTQAEREFLTVDGGHWWSEWNHLVRLDHKESLIFELAVLPEQWTLFRGRN